MLYNIRGKNVQNNPAFGTKILISGPVSYTHLTGQYYVEGDEDWGFAGLPAECVPYSNGSLAVQDMINGNLKYVIIDAAPAQFITEAINSVQS